MRIRKSMTRSALLLAMAATLGTTVASGAADPTGTYGNADITGKIKDGFGFTERFDLIVAKFKLKRSKIRIDAVDEDLEVKIKVTLRLRDDVQNSNNQTVKVESGSLSIKDINSGTPLAWNGQFNNATFKVRLKGNGIWEIKHKRKLKIQNLAGVPEYNGGLVKGTKIKATR